MVKCAPLGATLSVRVRPRARRNVAKIVVEGVWQVCVSALPADNAANEAVVKVLSEALGCAKSSLRIVRGHKSRDKQILCEGLSAEELLQRLARVPPSCASGEG